MCALRMERDWNAGSLPSLPAPSHHCLPPPITTCLLPSPPAASHYYLPPPTTTCYLPLLPAAPHRYLPRLPAASHDYLLPPTTTCYFPRHLLSRDTCCPPRNGGTIAIVARKDDNTTGKVPQEKGW